MCVCAPVRYGLLCFRWTRGDRACGPISSTLAQRRSTAIFFFYFYQVHDISLYSRTRIKLISLALQLRVAWEKSSPAHSNLNPPSSLSKYLSTLALSSPLALSMLHIVDTVVTNTNIPLLYPYRIEHDQHPQDYLSSFPPGHDQSSLESPPLSSHSSFFQPYS